MPEELADTYHEFVRITMQSTIHECMAELNESGLSMQEIYNLPLTEFIMRCMRLRRGKPTVS